MEKLLIKKLHHSSKEMAERQASFVSLLQFRQSVRSTTSVRVFKHNHLTYRTCFGCLHVKTATVVIGLMVMAIIFVVLFYGVFSSMEDTNSSLKGYVIPTISVVISLLYLLVAVVQHRPCFLYPFITMQIVCLFTTAISSAMIAIAVGCHTTYILQVFVTVESPRHEYERRAMMMVSSLLSLLLVQLWALRSVCSCFRYFADLNRFKARQQDQFP